MSKTVISHILFARFTVDVQNRDSCEYIKFILDISVVVAGDYLYRLHLNVCSHLSGKRGP